jgi:glyoxylase-like metal-dependent hydrolase (beta-lactamase superfamily II)
VKPASATIVLAISLSTVCFTEASPVESLLESQQKAAAILARSVKAHGGVEGTRTFEVRATLENTSIHQSQKPEPPFRKWTVKARYVMDEAKDRFLIESDAKFGSYRNSTRTIGVGGKGQLIDLLAKTVVVEDNLAGGRSLLARILPQNVLGEALTRRASLRWVGQEDAGNCETVERISYVRPSGELYTISIDAKSGLVKKLEAVQTHTIDGDVTFVHEYGDYRRQAGLTVPFSYVIRRGPWTATSARVQEIRIGETSTDADFAVPAEFRTIASYDPEMSWETIAPGVHVINYVPGGYNVLCVEFADHVVVVETPEDNSPSGVSERVIAFVKQKIAGKPIRFAVPTHHHSDHVGGVRAYIAEGATIISTRNNEEFLSRLATRTSAVYVDALDRAPRSARFEFLKDDRMVLKEGGQELQLYVVRGAPHVDEMIVAYLPNQKLLFQTDLFNAWACFKERVPNEDIGHTTALGDTQALIKTVDGLGLHVEKVIGGHGRMVEYSWLKQYTARRSKDGLPMWACPAGELR